MEEALAMGEFAECNEHEVMEIGGGDIIIPLGGVFYHCNIVYSDTAFRDACIWGVGTAASAAVTGVGALVSVGAGAIGFMTSTASSINNGAAYVDHGFNF